MKLTELVSINQLYLFRLTSRTFNVYPDTKRYYSPSRVEFSICNSIELQNRETDIFLAQKEILGERGKYEVTLDSLPEETLLLAVSSDRLTGRDVFKLRGPEIGGEARVVPIERLEAEPEDEARGTEREGERKRDRQRARLSVLNRRG